MYLVFENFDMFFFSLNYFLPEWLCLWQFLSHFCASTLVFQQRLISFSFHSRRSEKVVFEGDLELVGGGELLALEAVVQVLLHDVRGDVHDRSFLLPVLET